MAAEDFMRNGKWECQKCGACCRLVGMHPQAVADGLDRGDGACKHLVELPGEATCAIFETRPRYCRSEYSPFAVATDFQRAKACSLLREKLG